ncbi:peptidase S8/S53 domain-containing protein [Circinella umbellata]|nr:peptidase S8/S53 domain-containing protein [Circinella umbellata]
MSILPQMQVDRVHNELKNTGRDIIIGVIDSGVDYMHPALGGGFGPGYKIRYGRDLVGDDYDSERGTDPMPDPDPIDTCDPDSGTVGHGTHVSGIIAGQSDNYTGVAPDAILGMWRIFGCDGNADATVIIEAMLDAYDTGVDIISMSLSDPMGWSESLTAIVAERITSKGVPVVAAASNSGELGAFTVGTPSVGKGVYSVASFDNNYNLFKAFKVNDKFYKFNVEEAAKKKMPNGQLVIGDKNIGSDTDACDPKTIPSDVNGKIALIRRGTCNFSDKANNLAKAGAIGVIVYNNIKDETLNPLTNGSNIPIIGITQEVGQEILTEFEMKRPELVVNVTFSDETRVLPQLTGNTVSSFSSIGPAYELDVRPSIGGVGGNILSTLPRQSGNWGVLSGTSMATPAVAGTVALYLRAWKDKNGPENKPSPAFILEHFQNYAHKAPNRNGENNVDSPNRQGAGLVQIYDAIQEQVHISPAAISFNDTEHLQKTQTLSITNYGNTVVSYIVSNNVSVSIIPYNTSEGYQFTAPATYGNDSAQLEFSQKIITLAPGATNNISVTVIPPNTNPAEHIMYGGYIQFKKQNESNTENLGRDLTVPYIGVVGNQRELPIFHHNTPQLTNTTNITHFPAYDSDDIFVFNRIESVATKKKIDRVPIFMLTLDNPTRLLSTPLYNEQYDMIGFASFKNDTAYFSRATSETPAQFIWWGGDYIPSQVKISVAPGNYRIGLNALKWFGNPDNPEDWETWTSGVIKVL